SGPSSAGPGYWCRSADNISLIVAGRSTAYIALAQHTLSRHPPCRKPYNQALDLSAAQENAGMQEFNNKVAVITGGGSGLGRELALSCAARGWNMVPCDVDEAGMQETLRLVE